MMSPVQKVLIWMTLESSRVPDSFIAAVYHGEESLLASECQQRCGSVELIHVCYERTGVSFQCLLSE